MTDNYDELSMGEKRIATIAKREAKNDKSKLRMQKLRERRKQEAAFDLERQQRLLIDPYESAPFIECATPDEQLMTSRRFAFALRWTGKDVPDITAEETVAQFAVRVMQAWYVGAGWTIAKLLNGRSGRFDAELGFRVDPEDFSDDQREMESRIPGLDKPIDIATLPHLGTERPAPVETPVVKIWEEQGFDSFEEYQRYEARQAADKLFKDAALASVAEEQAQYLKDAEQQGVKKDTVLFKTRTSL